MTLMPEVPEEGLEWLLRRPSGQRQPRGKTTHIFYLGSSRYESERELVLKMKTLPKLPYPTYLFGLIQMVGFLGLVYVQGEVLGW